MFEALAALDFLFWLPALLWVAVMLGMMDFDSGKGATVATAAFAGAMYFLGEWNPFPYLHSHLWDVVAYVASYVAIGAMWSLAKWVLYSMGQLREYKRRGFGSAKDYRPIAAKHKADILVWMSWWPFSMTWTLLDDPLRRLFLVVYELMAGLFQRVSDRIWAGHIS